MPHYPYVFDSRCALRPRTADWLTNRIASTDPLVYNTVDSRAQKYERYAEQVRCVLTHARRLLDTLESRGLLEDATIVVNGDHGSRIPTAFSERHDARRRRADRQRLTGIRSRRCTRSSAPGVPPGYDAATRCRSSNCSNHHLGGEPLSEPSSCRVFLLEERGDGTSHGGRAEVLRTVSRAWQDNCKEDR